MLQLKNSSALHKQSNCRSGTRVKAHSLTCDLLFCFCTEQDYYLGVNEERFPIAPIVQGHAKTSGETFFLEPLIHT